MGSVCKLEKTIELKVSAKLFYNTVKYVPCLLLHFAPTHFQSIDFPQDKKEDTDYAGVWIVKKYIEGEVKTTKERVEFVDERKEFTLTDLEGEYVKEGYKSLNKTFQLSQKNECTKLKLILEYEKLNDKVPPPNKFFDFMESAAKELDENISKKI